MPELALCCSQIDEYLKYHHRTFIQQLMETEVETNIRALGRAPKIQLNSGRSEKISKEVKTMLGTLINSFLN